MPIYVDSDLGNNLKGEVLSEKIYSMGFSEIYMATGHIAEDIKVPAWIKGVRGKTPPFLRNEYINRS